MDNSPVSYDEKIKLGLRREAPTIRIAFLDVGQGDTIVISSPETGEAIVVDCIDANAVLEYLEQEEIKYLRGIVITHLHDDHYCQVDDLLFRANLVPNMRECEMLACGNIPNRKFSDQLVQDIYDQLKLDSDGHQTELLDRQANSRGCKRIASKRGCPCAGTIIIELGDEPLIIQPSRVFHQDSIIIPHFHTHQCVLAPIHIQ